MTEGTPRWEMTASRWIALASAGMVVALPGATFVREHFAKKRELTVARAQQEFTIRSAYLGLAVDPARPPALRQGVLRFLVQTSDDERLRTWAEAELKIVGPEADGLRAELAKLRSAMEERDKRLASVTAALDRERQKSTKDAKMIADAQAEQAALAKSVANLEGRIAKTSDSLFGARVDATANISPAVGTGKAGSVSVRVEQRPADAPRP